MQLNARSCSSLDRVDKIKNYIQRCDYNIDIIVISETWFETNETCLYTIDGYVGHHSCRPNKRGGGLSIYIKERNIDCDATITTSTFNMIQIELKNYKGINNLNIIGYSRVGC